MTPSPSPRAALSVIFVTLLLDVMGYGMLIPVLPSHLQGVLGADRSEQGFIISLYMIAMVLALPVWGWLADRFGRRPVLIGCLVGTGLSFTLMAYATSLPLFALARVLQGIFGASVGTAQAYVTDVTPSHDRTKVFGLVGAATSLGVLGGPAIGGLLAFFHPVLAFLVPAFLAFLACAAAAAWLPETRSPRARPAGGMRELLRRSIPAPLLFFTSAHNAQTRLYLYLFFHIFAVFGAVEAMFPAYAQDVYGWGTVQAGLFLSYLAIISGVTQGLLLRRLSRRTSESSLVAFGLAITGAALIVLVRTGMSSLAAPAGLSLAIGFGFVVPVFTSLFSQSCGTEDQKGEYMSHGQAMLNLGRAFGAIAGGVLATRVSVAAPFVFAGFGALAALAVFLLGFPLLTPRRDPTREHLRP
jgi:MFS transporter, DHA1 family, tetracycline resistance protein